MKPEFDDPAFNTTSDLESVAFQRAEEIWESISDAFVAIDEHWRFVYANRSYLNLVSPLFRRRDELIGGNLWELFPDIVGTEVGRFYRLAVETQQAGELEVYYEPIDAYLEIRAFPSKNLLSVYVRDITQRRRQEISLQQLNQKVADQARVFDGILSNIPDLAYAFDRDQRVIYANRALLRLWGRTLEESVGKSWSELDYPQEVIDVIEPDMRQVLATKKPLAGEVFYLGEHHEYVFSPSLAEDGTAVAVVGTTRLATERKRAEAAAEGQRRTLQLIAEDAPLSVVLEELIRTVERQIRGDAKGLVALLDEKGEILSLGAAPSLPAEVREAADDSPVGPDAGASGVAAWSKESVVVADIRTDPIFANARELVTAHGLRSCWATPILTGDGNVLGVFSMFNLESLEPGEEDRKLVEIAGRTAALAIERKRSQKELTQARDQAIAASQAKDDFLAALSHELRAPLNPALLLASEAASDPLLSERARETFASIRKSVMLEARLIDDLLDLTRIARGKVSLRKRTVDIHEILSESINTIRSDFHSKSVRLQVDIAKGSALAQGDEARLLQVFANVLKNALKFTPAGGSVQVGTRFVSDGEELELKVRDTGEGMTATELRRAFESFSQGEHASEGGASRFGGLGLGLAISRSFVQMHGGSITGASAGRGKGSVFTIKLPLERQERSTGVAPDNRDARRVAGRYDGRGRKILLVDDDANTRRVMELLLASRKFVVKKAGSVAEALSAAEEGGFDLLVSDIGLPDGTGYDLMYTLRSRQGLAGIALSGYGMEKDREQSRAAGFVEHLVKPTDVKSLEEALAKALDGVRV